MRFLTPYTRITLKESCRGRGYNSIFAPLSHTVTTNTKRLCLCRLPSPQPADIPSMDIPSMDILFVDILSTNIPSTDILFMDIPSTS